MYLAMFLIAIESHRLICGLQWMEFISVSSASPARNELWNSMINDDNTY